MWNKAFVSSVWKVWNLRAASESSQIQQKKSSPHQNKTIFYASEFLGTQCALCWCMRGQAIRTVLWTQTTVAEMFLPCRFCTRISLICPINSSLSNQSSQPCPAIWSRGEFRIPGQECWKSSPAKNEKLLLHRAAYCPSVRAESTTAVCQSVEAHSSCSLPQASVNAAMKRLTSTSMWEASGQQRRKKLQHLVGIFEVGWSCARARPPALARSPSLALALYTYTGSSGWWKITDGRT